MIFKQNWICNDCHYVTTFTGINEVHFESDFIKKCVNCESLNMERIDIKDYARVT